MVMESSQELETILNHSRDAFLLADNEGKILFLTPLLKNCRDSVSKNILKI